MVVYIQTIFHGIVFHLFPCPCRQPGTKKSSTVAESEDEELRHHGRPWFTPEKLEDIPIVHGKNPWFPVDVPLNFKPNH